MPTLTALYSVTTQFITPLNNPTTLTLSDCINLQTQLYGTVTWNNQTVPLDISKILRREANLTLSQTLDSYLAGMLTDLFISGYQASTFPQPDITGRYQNRLNVFEPVNTPGFSVCVAVPSGDAIAIPREITGNDLVITGPDDYSFNNCFVAINGILHNCFSTGSTLYVFDGYRNIRTRGSVDIVIGDTSALGGHALIPLDETMLENYNSNPWQSLVLNLGSIDITNTTVLLVVDGTLHVLDTTYRTIGANRLKLDVSRMNLIADFVHNPLISFNPPSRAQTINPILANDFLADQPIPSSLLAPGYGGAASYADDIGNFLQSLYPEIVQMMSTNASAYTSPVAIIGVDLPTFRTTQEIAQFLSAVWPTLTAQPNEVALVLDGPPPGATSVLQSFLCNDYPILLTTQPTLPAGQSNVGLLNLSPTIDDPAYPINDVLLNTYNYIVSEIPPSTVAHMTITETIGETDPYADAEEAINIFFSQYFPDLLASGGSSDPTQTVVTTDVQSLLDYEISLEGKNGLNMATALGRNFAYSRLFSSQSFLIVINNPNIFINRYVLQPTKTPHRFSWIGSDTPRGLLRYSNRHILPYTLLSSPDFHHFLHLDLPSQGIDIVQTSINPGLWPAPFYDQKNPLCPRSAELLELYSA